MIDVREEDEYMVEFISLNGVYHLHMSSIMDNLPCIPKDKPVIIVCKSGIHSIKMINIIGFSALPGVYRHSEGSVFYDLNERGWWRTTTEDPYRWRIYAWNWDAGYATAGSNPFPCKAVDGHYILCIKD
jgi:hypothetical protein